MDRQEDKEVRRISKKVRLDPMIDEDSGDEEDHHSPPSDLANSPSAPPEWHKGPSRTLDPHPVDENAGIALVPTSVASITAVPIPVGSALRKNADGSVVAPKLLPKRNKGAKVNETLPTS